MASVASQLIEEVTARVQSDSLEDAREICADGTYFPNKLRIRFILRRNESSLNSGNASIIHFIIHVLLHLKKSLRIIKCYNITCNFVLVSSCVDRLCGLVVRVSGYRYRGSGFDPRRYQIF